MTSTLLPTVLVLDFFDSYTRNILSLCAQLGAYGWAMEDWQDRVVVVSVDSLTWEEFVEDLLPSVSCIILGPGPGSPHKEKDFSWPTRLILEYGHSIPILGLCLGHQGLATAFGGLVIKAPTPVHGQISSIHHTGDSVFSGIPTTFEAVQFNSLVVSNEKLPIELEVTAWSDAGTEKSIMGLRHRQWPLWGVQFHPESICSTFGAQLLSNFLALSQKHAGGACINDSVAGLSRSVLARSTSHRPSVSQKPIHQREPHGWTQRSVQLDLGRGRSPQEVFEAVVRGPSSFSEIWLDSARPTGKPQHSHLSAPNFSWSYSVGTASIDIRTIDARSSVPVLPPQTFFSIVASAQSMLKRCTTVEDPMLASVPVGFVGYLGYEMKEISLPHCDSPARPPQTDAEFAFASTVLTFEHKTGLWRITGLVRNSPETLAEVAHLEGQMGCKFGVEERDWRNSIETINTFFETTIDAASRTRTPLAETLPSLVPDLTHKPYLSAIDQAKSLITAGESYELCLTTQFRSLVLPAVACDPYPLYLALRSSNPAPYSSYFRLRQSDITLLLSSPERFMHISKDGHAEMKPIKGTRQRSDDSVEDERRKIALENDAKEKAENLMIVDLCRNDLLGFCDVESVQVPRLMVVESFKTVHQLVTSVVGTLSEGVNPFEAVARAFPPGSMTGAPKLRSVRLLEELENHVPRGVYSGVFGYFAVDGTADFSVVIRTLVLKGTELTLGAGGAITHLSDSESEWQEVLTKKNAVVGRL